MRNDSGQVVLITLLVLTIATTVALSLIGRTTMDTTITSTIEDSSRAFNAAEAGIEQALISGPNTPTSAQVLAGEPGVLYRVSVGSVGGSTDIYEFPRKTEESITETVWLADHDAAGNIIETPPAYTSSSIGVCWSQESVTPALVISLLYKVTSDGSYRVYKGAFDPDPVRSTGNHFSPAYTPGGCDNNMQTAYKVTLDLTSLSPAVNTLIALRIRPVYSDTKLMIDPEGTILPEQGNRIESIGSTATGTNRKITVFQQHLSPSTIFDAALYSQGSISR